MNTASLFTAKKFIFSLEVFPPKKDTSVNVIYNTLLGLRGLPADFIRVTSVSYTHLDVYKRQVSEAAKYPENTTQIKIPTR